MFTGAQISLYPMTSEFVPVILDALKALDPWKDRLRIETDDISTLVVGPPEVLFPALRDLFVRAAATRAHVVLHATLSRGCPGEPDDPMCVTGALANPDEPVAQRVQDARAAVTGAAPTGEEAAAQMSLYVMGQGDHMAEIYGCIDFIKASGVFEKSKNFCTKLRGDAGPVFATVAEAFCRFGPPEGHVTVDLTVSANSPSKV
ncbi:Ykof family thiamine-binding protein [Pseudooceanicola sp. CBS1P-1]|uniref:HMP/thiamine-binding protein n=1 Tax=Pseudooceanicola albus TaxID=2692189 RepID=A0A6L7G1A2_9RHOB|nr:MULTISPECIES: YkoF family thiamine/hydroxymethylpyrimidine-binding protein [Pseudooceanicola]MBT9384882.1 Ykof family thiamine-binding protein [Pseudooceanicola endophyticus]MXN18124.1 HMP/thiamine-binding protein [Pseudooceanicola albus]